MLRLRLRGGVGGRSAWGALLSLVVLLARPAEASEPDALPVDALVTRALTDNPRLIALQERLDATLAQGHAARARFPDPMLSYSGWVSPIETRQGPQRHRVMIAQTFPWMRALRDAEAPYSAEAEAIAAELDAAMLEIAFEVRTAAISIARVDALIALQEQERVVYQDVLTHQEAVMAYAPVGHGDVLRTALAIDLANDALARLTAERDAAVATLRALLRVTDAEDIAVPATVLEDAGAAVDVDAMLATMPEQHPAFRAFAAREQAAERRAEAVRSARLPGPTVSAAWSQIGRYDMPMAGTGDGGRDAFMLGVSVPLPVNGRRVSLAEDAARAQGDTFARMAEDLRWRLIGEIEAAAVRLADARERIERLDRDLLPGVHDVIDHYAIALAHGDATHTEYLLALEQALELETRRVEARATVATERARLHMLTGTSIDTAASATDRPEDQP